MKLVDLQPATSEQLTLDFDETMPKNRVRHDAGHGPAVNPSSLCESRGHAIAALTPRTLRSSNTHDRTIRQSLQTQ